MKTVYYHECGWDSDDYDAFNRSPLADERFSFPIKSVLSETDRRFRFAKACPAWQHRAQRIFTVRSPIDMEFGFDFSEIKNTGQIYVQAPNMREDVYREITMPTFSDPDWFLRDPDRIMMQLKCPRIQLWTEDKDVWIEQRAHPEASGRNNIVLVEGWFSLSAWWRQMSFGYTVFDINKPVKIKSGDPIYQFVIHTKDKNERVRLIRKKPSEEVHNISQANVRLKNIRPSASKDYMFGQKEKQSKCPFSFLWNKNK